MGSSSSLTFGGFGTILIGSSTASCRNSRLSAPGLLRQPGEGLGVGVGEPKRRLDSGVLDPPIQFAIAAGEVMVHFALAQGVVVQIIEACVREPCVERAQVGEVARDLSPLSSVGGGVRCCRVSSGLWLPFS